MEFLKSKVSGFIFLFVFFIMVSCENDDDNVPINFQNTIYKQTQIKKRIPKTYQLFSSDSCKKQYLKFNNSVFFNVRNNTYNYKPYWNIIDTNCIKRKPYLTQNIST